MALLEASAEIAPQDFEEPYFWLGRYQLSRGNLGAAKVNLERAVSLDRYAVMATATLALVKTMFGENAEKIRLARRAVALAPGSHTCQYALGSVLQETGFHEEAAQALGRAVQLRGTNLSSVDARHRLAVALTALGNHGRAQSLWESVLRADPVHIGALKGLGRLSDGATP